MTATFAIAVGVGIGATVLSPGIVLDALSLWPGLIPGIVALLIVAIRRRWRTRAGAAPPLLILTWMVLAVGAHLAAWAPLPSSSVELAGPAEMVPAVTLSVHSAGRLELGVLAAKSPANEIYRVGFVRLGGEVGIPVAEEINNQTGLTVAISDSGTTTWFRYGGWRVQLTPLSQWNLSVGGDISGTLVGLDLASLSIDGSGALRLGEAGHLVPVAVRGNLLLTIPAGAPARVVGEAQVPETWTTTEDGSSAPVTGEGWLISVAEGATLVIDEA
jgi:hypothetical protein